MGRLHSRVRVTNEFRGVPLKGYWAVRESHCDAQHPRRLEDDLEIDPTLLQLLHHRHQLLWTAGEPIDRGADHDIDLSPLHGSPQRVQRLVSESGLAAGTRRVTVIRRSAYPVAEFELGVQRRNHSRFKLAD